MINGFAQSYYNQLILLINIRTWGKVQKVNSTLNPPYPYIINMKKKIIVTNEQLKQTFGDNLLDTGFTSIPNKLLDYQNELNLTDTEMLFFIKCYRQHPNKYIKDTELSMHSHRRTLSRIRKSLIKKRYLKLEYYYFIENTKIKGIGTKYNWTGLINAINHLITENTDVTNCQGYGQIVPPDDKMSHTNSLSLQSMNSLTQEEINNIQEQANRVRQEYDDDNDPLFAGDL